jgi:phospho-2-dehydro-3-deoxyheptonate aldolase
MIIKIEKTITKEQLAKIGETVGAVECHVEMMKGANDTILGVIGNVALLDIKLIQQLPGVKDVQRISAPYKLVSREYQAEDSIIKVGNVSIGDGNLVVVAGPCSVESAEQLNATIDYISKSPAQLIRGGIVKPRTSPYAFQGLGEDGLALMEAARQKHGLPIVCELMTVEQVEKWGPRLDMVQIGARNMQNFDLLKAAGKINTPILLKRGLSATIDEWLMSAEYIAANGNRNIVLCERGIRTYETAYRNVTDLNAIPLLKKLTHLPIMVDPSHATGIDWMAKPLAQAAVAVGADAIMLETHYKREIALSDGPQSLTKEQYLDAINSITKLHNFMKTEL